MAHQEQAPSVIETEFAAIDKLAVTSTTRWNSEPLVIFRLPSSAPATR